MIDPKFLTVFQKVYHSINDQDINWVLTGSLSFAFQGVDTEIHDIDIQTDQIGAYEIERLFSEYVTRKVTLSSSDKIKSHFGTIKIDGIEVEIMGDIQKRQNDGTWEDPVDLNGYKRFMNYNDMKIPVLSLEYEYTAYLKLERYEKAEMLRKRLDSIM